MLILAGVSLNAIVGYNGILTQAQSATFKSSIAVLEEYLQEKYVEEYENIEEQSYPLDYILRGYPEMFFIPKNEGFGSLNYIEIDGKAIYLIRKEGLPESIKEQLAGGDAGEKTYSDYASLKDVYGVTQKLKVYYCGDGIDSINGIAKSEVDEAIDRDVFEITAGKGLGDLLSNYDTSGDGQISSSEVRDIRTLEITSAIDLKDIYNLYALEKIIIKDVQNINLSGIEHLTKLNFIWMFNSTAENYEPIGKLSGKLERLYFQYFKDDQVNKFIDEIKSYDLPNLKYLSFWNTGSYSHGPQKCMDCWSNNGSEFGTSSSGITNLSKLSELSQITKNAIKYFYAEGNNLTSLEGITSLTNLITLKIQRNYLVNLNGINNLTNLEYLEISRNKLLDSSTRTEEEKINDSLYFLSGCSKLKLLNLSYNTDIVWINYIKDLPITNLYMYGLTNISTTDIINLKNKINSMGTKTFDKKYSLLLLDNTNTRVLDISGQTLTVSEFLNIGTCVNLSQLLMMNTKIVKDSSETLAADENTVEKLMIKVFTNLKKINYLDLAGFTINLGDGAGAQKIKNLNFINSSLKSYLNWIDLRNTDVIALGDNASLGASDKAISISNANLLNTITSLRTFIVDSDKYDFYYMQDLVNRMSGANYRLEKYYNAGGLTCFNNTSLKTLEKCDKITKIETYEYYSGINVNNTLDLSKCDSLTYLSLFGWLGTVKCPSSIKNISTLLPSTHFTFEDDGTDIILDYFRIDECGYEMWSSIVNELANSGVFVKDLYLDSIWGEGSLDCFFDKNGKCEWLDKLGYDYANWMEPYNYSRFYNEFNKLIGSSITKIYFAYSPVLNLDFLDGFEEQLTSISITSSKLQNINKIKNFTNLTYLHLGYNYITNVSSLETLTGLKKLYLNNNSIGFGLEALENLHEVEFIHLSGNNLYTNNYANIANGEAKESFINIFKNLHVNHNLKELYLKGINLTNVKDRLNVSPEWKKLECDS